MSTHPEETLNLLPALLGYAAKRILELSGGAYSISQVDEDILHACAKNSSFIGENLVGAKSVGEAHVVARDYARKQALLRATSMLRMTRADYWSDALQSAKRDEQYYSLLASSDIATHNTYTTSPEEGYAVEDIVLDEAGNALQATIVLPGKPKETGLA